MLAPKTRSLITIISWATTPLQLIMTVAFSVVTGTARADVDTLWTKLYEPSAARAVHQTANGGYVFVQASPNPEGDSDSDFHLVWTDALGDTIRSRYYGGDSTDLPYSLQLTSDGGYVIAGVSYTSDSSSQVCLVKTDSLGNAEFIRTYGGEGIDEGRSVQQTADGGYVMCGSTTSIGAGGYDYLLIKTDSAGELIWMRAYGGPDAEWGYAVQQADDGGFIMAGDGGWGEFSYNLIKVDSLGDWVWGIGPNATAYYALGKTSDGKFVAVGESCVYDPYGEWCQMRVVKFDSEGATEWVRTYGTLGKSTVGYSVRQTGDGGYFFTGRVIGSYDGLFMVKTNSFGIYGWIFELAPNGVVKGYDAEPTVDGRYIVAGSVNDHAWLVKMGELTSLSIEMIPYDDPIVVQPGDSLTYNGILTNNFGNSTTTDVWVMVDVYNYGLFGPVLRINNIPLAGYQITGGPMSQIVPEYTPNGAYDYIAYCGDYPDTKIDSASFPFWVVGATGVDNGGSGDENLSVPQTTELLDNFPNPFNSNTSFRYALSSDADVKLEIFNLLGQKIATLIDERQTAGFKLVVWDGSGYSSGVYFYTLTVDGEIFIRRMTALK